MSYINDKIHEIELFMEGIASVCDNESIIKEKTIEKYGEDFKPLIVHLIELKTKDFSKEQFVSFLDKHDAENNFSNSVINCAKRNGFVIVYGYSDDLIELKGAIPKEGDCFRGGEFHLSQENNEWKLKNGNGTCNNIVAKWCDGKSTDEFGETIPWTYETDIPFADFFMTFRGDPFCKGFVFDIKDLKF